MSIKTNFQNFMSDESGATAVEYGLIAVAMATMLIPAILALSTTVREELYDVIAGLFDLV
jgi:pilus assembly protein Flp/PilA